MAIDLDDPIAVMLAASQAFERAGIAAAAYGGLAVAMYGEPRETRDADLAVAGVDPDDARRNLATVGVTVVVTFDGMRLGGCDVTRLTLVGGGPLNTVDLVEPRSRRYAEAVLERRVRGSLRGHELAVVAPEDLVILKVLATRDRDLEDARGVLAKQGMRLDLALIDAELAALGMEITDHAIAARWAAIR